ncbi:CTLH/CRA C-terminal to lish motif domain-containing protein [Scheffersomyces coipomensis]|uniref:CTLH/CRA C-terminal to lish motif domain-containing protein n=1 Tax=Scheffersomyces coipomensis TaxID=1788519 RepID=UPI00315D3BD7
MGVSLLDNLQSDIDIFNKSANDSLHNLWNESNSFLNELKGFEQSIIDNDDFEVTKLEKLGDKWYKNSINELKLYNTATNKFSKAINNPKDTIDLDEAYTYPLNLNNFPVTPTSKDSTNHDFNLKSIKLENREELIKAIIIHLLKVGQCDIVKDIVKELPPNSKVDIDESLLEKFELLNKIVDDIVVRHDLQRVLQWFKDKYKEDAIPGILNTPIIAPSNIEFKFHMLQFVLLLNTTNALDAYLYSKDNFSKFIKEYLYGISPLMTLLLINVNPNPEKYVNDKMLGELVSKLRHSFNSERERKKTNQEEFKFVSELLDNFQTIHQNQAMFVNIANEFISEYCKDLKLSNDSSLFQSILAGHIYLPSFYKYNQIQSKLPTTIINDGDDKKNEVQLVNFEATYHFDLPFQLPDSNRFIFNYHPIFICPISREQSIPITEISENQDEEHKNKKKKRSYLDSNNSSNNSSGAIANPVVVLSQCQHLALRESVWHLSKKGTEIFKCHYCYKKHKFSDVTEAYFIDL